MNGPMEPPGHPPRLGFGMEARLDPDASKLSVLGERLQSLGYAELWANDGGDRSGLATLAAARGSSDLDLGVGVAPLSHRSTDEIVEGVARWALPHERLVLGVGTGSGSSLDLVRDAVATLRERVPGVRVAISALGPRMCRLGGEVADVVLLNWAFPDRIAWSRARIAEGAAAADRPVPRVACYVRVAIGPEAGERLAAEGRRYAGRPRPYTRLFEEEGVSQRGFPGVAAAAPADVPAQLAPYRAALDSCVVRALPAGASVQELVDIAAAAAGATLRA